VQAASTTPRPTEENADMCLPTKTDESSSTPGSDARSLLGIGGLMLLACLGGPALVGALGGLGAGVLLGDGAVFALALCAAVPAVALAWRRRSSRRQPTPEL
jgi:hypothetical protein